MDGNPERGWRVTPPVLASPISAIGMVNWKSLENHPKAVTQKRRISIYKATRVHQRAPTPYLSHLDDLSRQPELTYCMVLPFEQRF